MNVLPAHGDTFIGWLHAPDLITPTSDLAAVHADIMYDSLQWQLRQWGGIYDAHITHSAPAPARVACGNIVLPLRNWTGLHVTDPYTGEPISKESFQDAREHLARLAVRGTPKLPGRIMDLHIIPRTEAPSDGVWAPDALLKEARKLARGAKIDPKKLTLRTPRTPDLSFLRQAV